MTTAAPVPRWNPFRRHIRDSNVEVLGTPPTQNDTRSKTWGTAVSRVHSWPEEARALKKHTWISYVYGIGDVLLVLVPVYFILLGVAAISLNGKPTEGNSFGPKVETAMQLGPTMFPIVFAAISGRSMKMIARYLAEKGAKLSTLELMMASQSVWGTFESQLLMQRLTFVGANLLFLWALSPLGGQASLRLMTRDQEATYGSTKLRYLSTGPAGTLYGYAVGGSQRGKSAEAGALYNAALLAPQTVKLGPQDAWGNVKIPSIETFNQSDADSEGWYKIPKTFPSPESYSSLVGLPFAGLPDKWRGSNFSVEYNYLTVDCGSFDQKPYPGTHGTDDPTATNYTKLDEMIPGQIWYNKSVPSVQPFNLLDGPSSFLFDTTRPLARPSLNGIKPNGSDIYLGRLDAVYGNFNKSRLSEKESQTPRELVFASVYGISRDGLEQGLNIAKCSLFQRHVEADVECDGPECVAVRMRKSTTDTRPEALTALEEIGGMTKLVTAFPTSLKFSAGSSPTELFMANTSAFPFVQKLGRQMSTDAYVDLSKLSPEVFSKRFSLMLNTYYQLSSQSSGYFGGLPQNLSAYGPETPPVTDIDAYLPSNFSASNHSYYEWEGKFQVKALDLELPFLGATTTAGIKTGREIFLCNFAWIGLLLVSSTVILLIGSAAVVLKRKTLGPEMFGLVSSMTYENSWVKVPDGGTMLDAMERTRLLKDIEVRVGDVRGDEDIGHIALAAGVPVRKLERERLYH